MYASETETKEKWKITWDKKKITRNYNICIVTSNLFIFSVVLFCWQESHIILNWGSWVVQLNQPTQQSVAVGQYCRAAESRQQSYR